MMRFFISLMFIFGSLILFGQQAGGTTKPDPSITDWISAAGVLLGVPTAVYGIFKLFAKDKQREAEMQSLKEMILSLEKQAAALNTQTGLLSKEIHLKENIARASLQPAFIIVTGESHLSKKGFTITFKNTGEKAIIQKLGNEKNLEKFSWTDSSLLQDLVVNRGEKFVVSAHYVPYWENLQTLAAEEAAMADLVWGVPEDIFHFDIVYRDMIGNAYQQEVYRVQNGYSSSFNIQKAVGLYGSTAAQVH